MPTVLREYGVPSARASVGDPDGARLDTVEGCPRGINIVLVDVVPWFVDPDSWNALAVTEGGAPDDVAAFLCHTFLPVLDDNGLEAAEGAPGLVPGAPSGGPEAGGRLTGGALRAAVAGRTTNGRIVAAVLDWRGAGGGVESPPVAALATLGLPRGGLKRIRWPALQRNVEAAVEAGYADALYGAVLAHFLGLAGTGRTVAEERRRVGIARDGVTMADRVFGESLRSGDWAGAPDAGCGGFAAFGELTMGSPITLFGAPVAAGEGSAPH